MVAVSEATASHVQDESSGKPLKLLVRNDGKISANGGGGADRRRGARVVDSVINTKGTIEANSVGMRNGQIVLSADTVKVAGTLSAAGIVNGTKGGKITISGEKIKVKNA